MGRAEQFRAFLLDGPQQLGQSKVQNLRVAFCADGNVGWLQIAVHDATVVRFLRTRGDVHCEFNDFLFRERLAWKPVGESFSGDVLHNEKVEPIVRPKIVDRLDRGVIEFCQRRGLFAKMAASGLVGERAGGQYFYAHVALKLLIPRQIHHTHAARGEFFEDAWILSQDCG